PLKLFPPARIVPEPLAQFRAGRHLLQPKIHGGRRLGHSARPESFHQNPLAISRGRGVIRAFQVKHGLHLRLALQDYRRHMSLSLVIISRRRPYHFEEQRCESRLPLFPLPWLFSSSGARRPNQRPDLSIHFCLALLKSMGDRGISWLGTSIAIN